MKSVSPQKQLRLSLSLSGQKFRSELVLVSLITMLLFIGTKGIKAQSATDKVYLDNTEQFSIESKYVSNENYIIQVALPASYSHTEKSYPVLYVLDGDKSFGMTKGVADWLTWSNEIREIIIVGISYGKGNSAWWEKRARDYTQFKDTVYYYYPNAGGADNFLGFIKNELFPVINKNYRTKEDSNAIVGLSFGGLLSTYVLFKQPDMFKSYIIISPSLFWNNNSILNTEADYFSIHKALNKMVFMAYGSLDSNDWVINPANELIKIIQSRKYEGLSFIPQIIRGETHISVYPVALTHGLKAAFKR